MKKVGIGFGVLIAIGAIIWWAIGSDWRRLITNAPTNSEVLFWSQGQRDAGFRMLDRVPFMVKARKIEDGPNVRELPVGAPLEFDFDIDAYFESQRHSALVIVHNGKIRFER